MDDKAAEKRPDNGGQCPNACEVALNLAALVAREKVANDRHGNRLDGAGADALQQSKCDHRRHRPCKSSENGRN